MTISSKDEIHQQISDFLSTLSSTSEKDQLNEIRDQISVLVIDSIQYLSSTHELGRWEKYFISLSIERLFLEIGGIHFIDLSLLDFRDAFEKNRVNLPAGLEKFDTINESSIINRLNIIRNLNGLKNL